MPKTFIQLTVSERLKLLWKFLDFVTKNADLTTKEIMKRFAAENDLSEWSVRRIYDLLWFSDLIRSYGRPPKYRLTPDGIRFHARGFTLEEIGRRLPRHLYNYLKSPPKITITKLTAKFKIKSFEFFLPQKWNYRVFVRSPSNWSGAGYGDLDPGWLEAFNISRENTGKPYSIKHRTIVLLQTLELFKKDETTVNFFSLPDGYRWLKMSEDMWNARKQKYPPEKLRKMRARTMIFDPKNKVKVKELPAKNGGRRWVVEFMEYSEFLPKLIPVKDVVDIFKEKRLSPRRKVWEESKAEVIYWSGWNV